MQLQHTTLLFKFEVMITPILYYLSCINIKEKSSFEVLQKKRIVSQKPLSTYSNSMERFWSVPVCGIDLGMLLVHILRVSIFGLDECKEC